MEIRMDTTISGGNAKMTNKGKTKCNQCKHLFEHTHNLNGNKFCDDCYKSKININYRYVFTGEMFEKLQKMIENEEEGIGNFTFDSLDVIMNKKIEKLFIADKKSKTWELSEIINQQSELIVQLATMMMILRQKLRIVDNFLRESEGFGVINEQLNELTGLFETDSDDDDNMKKNKNMFV